MKILTSFCCNAGRSGLFVLRFNDNKSDSHVGMELSFPEY